MDNTTKTSAHKLVDIKMGHVGKEIYVDTVYLLPFAIIPVGYPKLKKKQGDRYDESRSHWVEQRIY
ncbi:hypothetical protein H8S75_26885 [Hungatella sp. L12]|uniref:Uncharacterized protein n=1 Tax=Hungatella hominis TaxID=2763050 RepID=A0ABR7HEH4_9FIRM|nr:hypothetical protein [Hungatella hominis]MBC5711563.1 hypothetical protein [Hungatella hominis]